LFDQTHGLISSEIVLRVINISLNFNFKRIFYYTMSSQLLRFIFKQDFLKLTRGPQRLLAGPHAAREVWPYPVFANDNHNDLT
jgi:hypothetical protein